MATKNNFPKLHNAAWPGVVGKGPDSEPPIALDTMLDLTAAAEVDGIKFDGFDLFLFDPHVSIDASDDELKALADKAQSRNLVIGSVVAPVWGPTGGGSAMGDEAERKQFLDAGAKRAVGSPANCANWAFAPMAWCASIRPRASSEWATAIVEANTKTHRRDVH